MNLPPWNTRGPKNPSTPQESHMVEASWTRGHGYLFKSSVCSDGQLRDHVGNVGLSIDACIVSPVLPSYSKWSEPDSHTANGPEPTSWRFRLIISLRDDSYLLADRPFDLPSSFDLCTFSLTKATLRALLRNLGLESRFPASITSLQDDSMFSFVWKEQAAPALSYVMRTERALPSDLALAPNKSLTGSDKQHPMLMALLLSEIQHERHVHLSREYWRRFNILSSDIQAKANRLAMTPPAAPMSDARDLSEIPGWLATVFEMHSKHGVMHRYLCAFRANLETLLRLTGQMDHVPVTASGDKAFNASGNAIAQRLQQISAVYLDLEQQAMILKEGANLHLTTIWSLIAQRDSQIAQRANIINQEIAQSNRIIAHASGQDSSAMKALAVLTMVFLPGTTIATILSLPTFDWEARRSWPTARPSTWVYILLSTALTALVLYAWRFWFLGTIWEKDVATGNRASYRVLDHLLLRRHDRGRDLGIDMDRGYGGKEEIQIVEGKSNKMGSSSSPAGRTPDPPVVARGGQA
ncbi:hypothetical protein BJX99DRAFT_255755 [Aspergillus californicus]